MGSRHAMPMTATGVTGVVLSTSYLFVQVPLAVPPRNRTQSNPGETFKPISKNRQ